MRTSNTHKHESNQAVGKYTGNGFIPSKQARKSQYTPIVLLWVLIAIVVMICVIVAHVVLQVVS